MKALQNAIEYFFYRVLAFVVASLPLRAVQRFGMGLGSFIYTVLPIRKRVVFENLQRAFPEKSDAEREAIALGSYRNLFCTLLESLWFVRLTPEMITRMVEVRNGDLLLRALEAGKGLIVLSGHYGNWELMAIGLPIFARVPFVVIAQKQRNTYVDAYVTAMREHLGNTMVMMDQAPRVVLRTLHNGGAIALLADQSGPQDGLFIKFFGHYTSTHKGPAIFSMRTGAPIVMTYTHRNADGTFRIECELLDMTGVSGTDEEKVRRLTELHVKALEDHIRAYPEPWLWMHKRWKHPYKEELKAAV
ncbi:MAG TPA: lysophospholipid acyltransferase family protein [Bacteroidota bacterium]|nr:lysophospholipid acyltransferase family protein [Bacteroidota bacterium]